MLECAVMTVSIAYDTLEDRGAILERGRSGAFCPWEAEPSALSPRATKRPLRHEFRNAVRRPDPGSTAARASLGERRFSNAARTRCN
jgi:DNA-binding transcriptional MocR family regulator